MNDMTPHAIDIDVGWTKYSTTGATRVSNFASIIDSNPGGSSLDDAIGNHFELYEGGGGYILTYRVIGQRAAFEPGFVAAEGIVPLPRDIGDLIRARGRAREAPTTEPTSSTQPLPKRDDLQDVLRDLEAAEKLLPATAEFTDLSHDLQEMRLSLNIAAYRAFLAMAGRVLEASLKAVLRRHGQDISSDWMVGTLLSKMEEGGIYVDPAMKNVWNIINKQRIVGVHAKEAAPIPSREQAIMVAYAVIDTLKRRLADGA